MKDKAKAGEKLGRAFAKYYDAALNVDACIQAVKAQHQTIQDFLDGKHIAQDKSGYPRLIGALTILQFEDGSIDVHRHGVLTREYEISTLSALLNNAVTLGSSVPGDRA